MENRGVTSSPWTKEGCRKRINYQTTQVIHWNLLRITTKNTIIWCDIVHLFVGRNNKKNTMEKNGWLNINIEDHIADLHCLFRYFKGMWPFLLTPISLYKSSFLSSRCQTEKKLILLRKKCWFPWWHSPFFLVKFLWYC